MDALKELLNSVVHNQLDKVKLLSNLIKFKVSFNEESSTIILKYKLALLENIILTERNENEKVDFNRLKKETEDYLKYHHAQLSKVSFKCTLAGCL